jgi:hypothetical protein
MNLTALMGVFFVFVVIGILALGLAVTIIACLLRKWKLAQRSAIGTVAAVVVTAAASVALMYFAWRPYDPTSPADLGKAYEADFGVLPPPGITVLKARQIVVGDSGGQWLLLKASPEEVTRHIAMGFTGKTQTPNDFNGLAGANAPDWWTPPTHRLELYENQNWNKGGGGWSDSRAAIGVDREAGLIWFAADKMN